MQNIAKCYNGTISPACASKTVAMTPTGMQLFFDEMLANTTFLITGIFQLYSSTQN